MSCNWAISGGSARCTSHSASAACASGRSNGSAAARPSPGSRPLSSGGAAPRRAQHRRRRLADRLDEQAVVALVAVVVGVEQSVTRLREHVVEADVAGRDAVVLALLDVVRAQERLAVVVPGAVPEGEAVQMAVGPAEHRLQHVVQLVRSQCRRQLQAAPHRRLRADQVDPHGDRAGRASTPAPASSRLHDRPSWRTGAGEVEQLPGRGTQLVEVGNGNPGRADRVVVGRVEAAPAAGPPRTGRARRRRGPEAGRHLGHQHGLTVDDLAGWVRARGRRGRARTGRRRAAARRRRG